MSYLLQNLVDNITVTLLREGISKDSYQLHIVPVDKILNGDLYNRPSLSPSVRRSSLLAVRPMFGRSLTRSVEFAV